MSALVGRYAAALRALVPLAETARHEQADCYVRARDILRTVAPCGACGSRGRHVKECPYCDGAALCLGCSGHGWTLAALEAYIADEERRAARQLAAVIAYTREAPNDEPNGPEEQAIDDMFRLVDTTPGPSLLKSDVCQIMARLCSVSADQVRELRLAFGLAEDGVTLETRL